MIEEWLDELIPSNAIETVEDRVCPFIKTKNVFFENLRWWNFLSILN